MLITLNDVMVSTDIQRCVSGDGDELEGWLVITGDPDSMKQTFHVMDFRHNVAKHRRKWSQTLLGGYPTSPKILAG